MKLGVLLCDHVNPLLQEEFGDYKEMFSLWLTQYDNSLELHCYYVVDGIFPNNIEDCDAYMASGSKASVNDDLPWINALERFIWQLFVARKPLVGLCFGHQLIAKTLGGKVSCSSKGWGIGIARTGVYDAKANPNSANIFNPKIYSTQSWMKPQPDNIKLIVSHQDQIFQLPPETEVLMGNEFCPYAMIQIEQHFVGLQGHPEFSREYGKAIMQSRKDIIDEATLMNGLNSLSQQTDDQLITGWLINFLKQGMKTIE